MAYMSEKRGEMTRRRHGHRVVNENYTVKPGERTIIVTPTAARTITLPPPWQWSGNFITVYASDTGAADPDSHTVTVSGSGEELNAFNSTLTAAGKHVTVFSDGLDLHKVTDATDDT